MTAIATDEAPTEGAVREEESPPLPVSGNAEASPPEQGALPATAVSAPPAGNGSASAASSSSNAVLQDKMDEVSAATASASAATVAPPPPAPVTQADSPGEEQPPPPQWDLRAVFARSQILAGHQVCMTDGCDLVACSLWEARGEEPWLSCLDCQEADYGGWPPAAEMPTEVLSKEHRLAISERCSGQDGPKMPVLPTEPPGAARTSPPKTKAVTPPPGTGLIGTATAAPHAPVAPSADASAPTAGTALPKPAAPKSALASQNKRL